MQPIRIAPEALLGVAAAIYPHVDVEPYKDEDQLERAEKAVSEACKILVAAINGAAKLSEELTKQAQSQASGIHVAQMVPVTPPGGFPGGQPGLGGVGR